MELLLRKLKDEQTMRLKSEEQHDTLMSEMVRTQKNLENEIRRLQDRQSSSPTRTPTKSPMRSPMRVPKQKPQEDSSDLSREQ